MVDDESREALELISKRLDWIEENLGRVQGLQYVAMGRAERRPDETPVPPEVQALAQAGKTDEVKLYRELSGVDFASAQAVIRDL